jgi:NADP-dependent 3-hydroxy acid dehydrogenase YdfG
VQEIGENQIRVGQISPGLVETEIFTTVKPDPKMPIKPQDFFKFFPNIKADHVSSYG